MQKPTLAPTERAAAVGAASANDQQIYFRIQPVAEGGPSIRPGDLVSYELMYDSDGRCYAINVEVLNAIDRNLLP